LGGVLLVGGLYSVLWGKSKENRIAPCGEINAIDGTEDERSVAEEKNGRIDQEKGEREQYNKVAAISPAEQV
jgi:hypothetical protein